MLVWGGGAWCGGEGLARGSLAGQEHMCMWRPQPPPVSALQKAKHVFLLLKLQSKLANRLQEWTCLSAFPALRLQAHNTMPSFINESWGSQT